MFTGVTSEFVFDTLSLGAAHMDDKIKSRECLFCLKIILGAVFYQLVAEAHVNMSWEAFQFQVYLVRHDFDL